MSRGTPGRNIRVPDALWTAALAKAERDGSTVTAVLLDALRRYVMPPAPKR